MTKNTEHIDLNDKNITNARFIQVNHLLRLDSHLTAKLVVVNSIDESSLVRNNQDNDFNNYNLTHINSITLQKQARNDNKVITKAYVDHFHQENERSQRDLGIDFQDDSSDLVKNNQDNDLYDKKLTNLDSIAVIRNATSDNEVSNKKFIDDELDKNTVLRYNQTLQNDLKVSVGNDTYKFTKYGKIKITNTTSIKDPNSGRRLLQKWNLKFTDKNNTGKIQNFVRSAETNSPSSHSGATSLPPIGNSFMNIEGSSNNHGDNVCVRWERTDIIQINILTFYYNRFSILTDDKLKNMGRFRIHLLLEDNIWSTQYTIHKNKQFTNPSTDWTLLILDFTVENYGNNLILDQIDTAPSVICFSNITITNFVY